MNYYFKGLRYLPEKHSRSSRNEHLSRRDFGRKATAYQELRLHAMFPSRSRLIQVSYLMSTQQTIDREFGAFSPITDASPKYVLSLDKLDLSRNGIGHVNLIDWLLHKVDLSLT